MKKERNNTIITEYCYEKDKLQSISIMLKGKSIFRCTECGKIFIGKNIEYHATIYSCPQPCKRCGGIRTLPVLHTIFISVYEKLWEDMKKKLDTHS